MRSRKLIQVVSFTLLAALLSTPAMAQKKKKGADESSRQAAPANLNALAQAAQKGGVNKCLARINQVTNFVGANSQVGASLFVAPTDADKKIASISMGVVSKQSFSYVDTQFSPGAGNTCSAAYEQVTYWKNSCQDVAAKVFGKFKPINPLGQGIATLDGGPNVRVFLMPADKGCVAIKKEVLF